MSVNVELAVILSTIGHGEIIKKLNHNEELSQSEILLIFNISDILSAIYFSISENCIFCLLFIILMIF